MGWADGPASGIFHGSLDHCSGHQNSRTTDRDHPLPPRMGHHHPETQERLCLTSPLHPHLGSLSAVSGPSWLSPGWCPPTPRREHCQITGPATRSPVHGPTAFSSPEDSTSNRIAPLLRLLSRATCCWWGSTKGDRPCRSRHLLSPGSPNHLTVHAEPLSTSADIPCPPQFGFPPMLFLLCIELLGPSPSYSSLSPQREQQFLETPSLGAA